MDCHFKLVKNIIFLFFLFAIVSCSKKSMQEDNSYDDSHAFLSYEIVDSIKFDIPKDLSPSFIMTKTKNVDNSKLYIGLADNVMQVFDLSNKRLGKRIDIPKEGPFHR